MFLIKKTLVRVINYKYFIKLNMIATFNKLKVYSDSEKYITFIIIIKVYKYYVLSFKLIINFFNY